MKTKFNFTGGEWIASLILAGFILFCYLFYFLYDGRTKPSTDMAQYAAVFEAFNQRQDRIRDSLAMVRRNSYPNHLGMGDTVPRKAAKQPMYEIVKIDLNRCDSTDITVVPMFGIKRAARLVEYRDKLGGFHSLSQLREVFVLQDIPMDLLEKYFVVHPADIRKININTATYKEMVNHPYFDAYLTKTILNYRTKNGNITSFEELQRITHAYPELMERLRWYVVF
ncbi:MAG: helix-hairpin-helix domain-containing protein [Bacteroidales bacterium]|nr:helix-hairpin-helix domain-containing protein [Bacteroidales bacterium]